jgi:hypothetical protein
VEEIVVPGSRMSGELHSVFAQPDVDAMLREMAPRYGSSGGAEGAVARDTTKQPEEDPKKCVDDCRRLAEPFVQMTAGAAGGALGGLVAGAPMPGLGSGSAAVVGGFAGAITGLVTGDLSISGVSGPTSFAIGSATGLAAGGNAALLQGGANAVQSVAAGGISGGVATVFPTGVTGAGGAAAASAALAFGATKVVAAVGLGASAAYRAADMAAIAICSTGCGD